MHGGALLAEEGLTSFAPFNLVVDAAESAIQLLVYACRGIRNA
jgi:hypothetical protein